MGKVKEAMKTYFEAYEQFCMERTGELPVTSYDPDITPPVVYIGECDEDEYIHWQAVEKAGPAEVSDPALHADLREFWNSYWFVEIVGCMPSGEGDVISRLKRVVSSIVGRMPSEEDEPYLFHLDGVLPGLTDTGFETERYQPNGSHMTYIPIGSEETTEDNIVVENATGAVWMQDHETGTLHKKVADSIPRFLLTLTDNLSQFEDNED